MIYFSTYAYGTQSYKRSKYYVLFISGFFDKAKKKILGDRVDEVISPNGEVRSSGDLSIILSGYDPSWWEDQELGMIFVSSPYFISLDHSLTMFLSENLLYL